jgi:hypothetical protein
LNIPKLIFQYQQKKPDWNRIFFHAHPKKDFVLTDLFLPKKPGALHPVASSTLKRWRAFDSAGKINFIYSAVD